MHTLGTPPTLSADTRAGWDFLRPLTHNSLRQRIWDAHNTDILATGQAVVALSDDLFGGLTYTVSGGIYPYELIITGMERPLALAAVKAAREELGRRNVTALAPGDRLLLNDSPVGPLTLTPAPEGIAEGALYALDRTPGADVYQLVWPDPQGRYPWDAGVEEKAAWIQGYGDNPRSLRLATPDDFSGEDF